MNPQHVILDIILRTLVPIMGIASILCFVMAFWSAARKASKNMFLKTALPALLVTFYFWFDSYGNPHVMYVNDQWTSLIVWLNSELPTIHPNITPVYPQPNPQPPAI